MTSLISNNTVSPISARFLLPGLRSLGIALATLMFVLAVPAHIAAQGVPYVDPEDALGIWDFNNPATPAQSADSIYATPIVFQGNTAFSADAGGRTGGPGDRAMNFGTAGGSSAKITSAAFMALLNQSNTTNDQLSVVFWQKWSATIANSSTVWFQSASATANRGLQAHLPYGDNTVYCDTSGCCAVPAQRLSASINALLPAFNWQQWHHIALVKNGGAKEIWIDGQLLVSQPAGVSALLGDWTEVLLGQQLGSAGNVLKGLLDDFAIFGTGLQPSQIAVLAGGASPASLLVPSENRPPGISGLSPAAEAMFHPVNGGISFTATTFAPNTIPTGNIHLFLDNADVTGSLTIGGTTTNRTVSYSGAFLPDRRYNARAEVTDNAGRQTVLTWTFDTADPAITPAHKSLALASLGTASQSSGSGAAQALDGVSTTITETSNTPGSYWELELEREVRVSRLVLTAPTGAAYAGIMDGLMLRFYNLRGQLVYETSVGPVQPGAMWAAFLPAGIDARIVRLELPDGQTNGAGDYRIALADIQVLGDASPAFGPLDLAAIATATQSSTAGASAAALAIDANASTVSETNDVANSHWLLTLDRSRPVTRVELVNRSDANSTRMGGLTLRLLDQQSNTLATTTVTDPGAGGTWSFNVPTGTADARYIRIGLENNAVNNQGNRIVSLAGVSVFTGVNYAQGADCYMVRLHDSLPSPSNANDGNYATYTETSAATVDGYWETDLGAVRSLYSVRAVAFDSADHLTRLRHATVRLFDENHDSVYSKHLDGNSANFDVALPGPINARYVRVGYENKERSSLTGGTEWWLRLREVQAFGCPVEQSGITSFSASPAQIAGGQSATLTWQQEDLREMTLHPGFGSVGARVNAQGTGALEVTPAASTEYILTGKSHAGTTARYVTVQVNGQSLPPRISEFVASNRLSLRDGFNDSPDWIEIHNPNGTPLDLSGSGLSDNPAIPMKWTFPTGTSIAAHGYLVVFASGRNTAADVKGFPHTNFSLGSSSESVVLTAANGTSALDSIPVYPPQLEDLAYGRNPDGSLGFLAPTPGALNSTGALTGWLNPPVFSHSRGIYNQSFSLIITRPDPAAELLVSLDGSEPTQPYTGPIPVNGNLTVRAQVRRAGFQSPRIQTHTYVFPDSVMASPLMNTAYTQGALSTRLRNSLTQLPTVCLSVPQLPDDYNEREASLEIIMPDGSTPLQLNAGLTRFGGAYTLYAKKSYRVRFRTEYGARKLETPLLRGFDRGMPVLDEIDTLDLTAGNQDMWERGFYMANRFVEDTMLEMGSLNPHGRFVHVYVNGTYWGQYNAHERLEDAFLAGYLGGSDEDYVNVAGNDNAGSDFVSGTPEPPNRQPWETLRANRNSYVAVKAHVDVTHLIDLMLTWFYGNSETEFRAAGPIVPGSGFKFWMADADGFLRTAALNLDTTNNTGPGGIFGALVAEGHPDFKALLADRIQKHFFNNGALTYERNLARLNKRMTEVQDSLIAECARWNYRTPTNWESAAQTIRTGLFPLRTSNLFTLLKNRGFYPTVDPPVLSQHGGSVPQGYGLTLNSANGTIYYSLDGTDPRQSGGGVAPGALALNVSQNTHVAMNSQWRFWDLGSLPAANWNTTAYNDTAWQSGTAPLGYGSGDEAKVISYGPNASAKYPAAYFRKSFTVANPASISSLTLGLVRDDGAIVYLNGTEVVRENMPAGTVSYATLASTAISSTAKYTVLNFSVPKNLLVAGTNVVAVEMHQATANSSDLRFDLSLTDSSLPSLILNQNTNFKARYLASGTWSALTEAAFHVTHPLAAAGPYVFDRWDSTETSATYPPGMRFFQTDTLDPGLSAAMETPWSLPYNLTSRSRINGLGTDGISFINTGSVQTTPGAGFVGAAVLALDTRSAQDIRVTWTGGTVEPNERDYGIRLQYRAGGSGTFLDVTAPNGNPVEYIKNIQPGHSAVIGPVTLPRAAENQSLVELRWRYYFRSGNDGSRPRLRIDSIQVTAGPVVAESLALTNPPATAQAGAVAAPVSVHALGSNGAVAENFTGTVTIAIAGHSGMLGGTTSRTAVNGRVVFNDLVFPQPGTYTLTATAGGLPSATSTIVTRVVGLSEIVMPRFIQGAYPDNNQRVPFACLLRFEGLLPNATYRYANQIVNEDDTPDQEGAGNMIFVRTAGASFVRSTESPRFLPGDLLVRHGEFLTDATGGHTRWFVTEPTGNVRFSDGNTVRVRIQLNDGANGDLPVHSLTATGPLRVLSFGTGTNNGSAFYAKSAAAPRNFAVLYEDGAGATRPVAATPVEGTGAAVDAGYAQFYRTVVAGQSGRWGAIIPNLLPGALQRVEQRDLLTGGIVSTFASEDGILPTANPTNGGQAIGLNIPGAGASAFVLWQSRFFSLDQLDNPALGGVVGDADSDGIANLLEYAFGFNPLHPETEGLPVASMETFNGSPHLVFRHRRLIGNHGLEYLIQISDNANNWQDAAGAWAGSEETIANPDGLTETITRRLPIIPSSAHRFLRLRVRDP